MCWLISDTFKSKFSFEIVFLDEATSGRILLLALKGRLVFVKLLLPLLLLLLRNPLLGPEDFAANELVVVLLANDANPLSTDFSRPNTF